MKTTHGLIGLAAILALFAMPLASARPGYRSQLIQQFALTPDKDGKASVTCAYCHSQPSGGQGWNKYGELVRSQMKGDAKGDVSVALYLSVKAAKDSDGDGYSDGAEIFVGTLPGDPDNKPLVEAETAQERFVKAGGAEIYNPKK